MLGSFLTEKSYLYVVIRCTKILFILFAIYSANSFGQKEYVFSKHRVFLEIFGHGGFGSVNYEKNLIKWETKKTHWTFRTGLSVVPGDPNSGFSFVFPNSINFLYGRRHLLEVGLGEAVTVNTTGAIFVRMMPVLGYRFMKSEIPWFFRATYTPFISHIWDIRLSHWGGVSLGYKF